MEDKQKTTFSSAESLKLQTSDPDHLHLRTITLYGSAAGEQDAKLLPGVLQDNQELCLAKQEEKVMVCLTLPCSFISQGTHPPSLLQTKRRICKFLRVLTDVSSTDMQMSIRCLPAFIHKDFNIWADLRSGLHCFHSIWAATSRRPQALSDIWRTPAQTDPLQWKLKRETGWMSRSLNIVKKHPWCLLSVQAIFEIAAVLGHITVSHKVGTAASAGLSAEWTCPWAGRGRTHLMLMLALWQPVCILSLWLISTLSPLYEASVASHFIKL